MILGRRLRLGNLLPIGVVFPLLLGVSYRLQLRVICFCDWWSLCRPEVSLRYVSNLILDLIHSEIVIIDFIPLFHNLYLLQVLLASSETTIIVTVDLIMMMMMLRAYAVINAGSSWAMSLMRLSAKTPNLSLCPPLPVGLYLFTSLFILENMVAKVLYRGLVSGRCWLYCWLCLTCSALSFYSSELWIVQAWWLGNQQ